MESLFDETCGALTNSLCVGAWWRGKVHPLHAILVTKFPAFDMAIRKRDVVGGVMARSGRVDESAAADHIDYEPTFVDAAFVFIDEDERLRGSRIHDVCFLAENAKLLLLRQWNTAHPTVDAIAADARVSTDAVLSDGQR